MIRESLHTARAVLVAWAALTIAFYQKDGLRGLAFGVWFGWMFSFMAVYMGASLQKEIERLNNEAV